MVKKVIMNLDSSKASGPDCILLAVLKKCESELSYILAKLFNNCLKESLSKLANAKLKSLFFFYILLL